MLCDESSFGYKFVVTLEYMSETIKFDLCMFIKCTVHLYPGWFSLHVFLFTVFVSPCSACGHFYLRRHPNRDGAAAHARDHQRQLAGRKPGEVDH